MEILLLIRLATEFLSRQGPSATAEEKALFDEIAELVAELNDGTLIEDGTLIRDALVAAKEIQ